MLLGETALINPFHASVIWHRLKLLMNMLQGQGHNTTTMNYQQWWHFISWFFEMKWSIRQYLWCRQFMTRKWARLGVNDTAKAWINVEYIRKLHWQINEVEIYMSSKILYQNRQTFCELILTKHFVESHLNHCLKTIMDMQTLVEYCITFLHPNTDMSLFS